MIKNLLIVVPPGTKVRYMENAVVEGMIALDMDAFEITKMFATHTQILLGEPIYDAEQYKSSPVPSPNSEPSESS